jgi:hypothetical protein
MPTEYEIDKMAGIIRFDVRGAITTEEMFQTLDRVVADPDFRAGMKVLSDHRRMETVVTSDFLMAFVRYLDDHGEAFRGSTWALVEASEAGYGMGRVAAALTEFQSVDMQVFRDIDQARRWLEAEAPARPR